MITEDLRVVKDLCKGCGICGAVCPVEAVRIERNRLGLYHPKIDQAKCLRCMLCVRSCPANIYDIRERLENVALFAGDEDLFGSFVASYAGYAREEAVRHNASSGGLVTSLLLSALEDGVIDSALTVSLNNGDPLRPSATIAHHKEAILESMGSVYLPVEFSRSLRRVIYDDSIRRIGIVGTSCHIEGIKKAALLIPSLSRKIAFTIGLFCKQTKDLRFSDVILSKMGIRREDLKKIKFRGEGWPGYIQAQTKDGRFFKTPFLDSGLFWIALSCTPLHCLLCASPMAESADISIGDAWMKRYKREENGVSVLIARTERGAKIITKAVENKKIFLEDLSYKEILDIQPRFAVCARKRNFESRLKLLSFFNHDIPSLSCRVFHPRLLKRYPEAVWIFWLRFTSSLSFFRNLFIFLPKNISKGLSRMVIFISKMFFLIGE